MSDPSIIRTEFASAEDAAEVYGVSRKRVATLRRALKPSAKRRIKAALARKRSRKKAIKARS